MSLNSITSLRDEAIAPFELGYIKAAAQDEAYNAFVKVFLEERKKRPTLTRAFVSRRTGKSPEQITRYISSPGNWTLSTYAVLCAAIGYKPVFGLTKIDGLRRSNSSHQIVAQCDADTSVVGGMTRQATDPQSAKVARVWPYNPNLNAETPTDPRHLLAPLPTPNNSPAPPWSNGRPFEDASDTFSSRI